MAWLSIHFHSEALRMPVPMEVLLPQRISGGSRKGVGSGPYPTLYLLHDLGDDHTSWIRRTAIERLVEELPIAIVMPAGHKGWYTDMVYGRDYFRFISEELPLLSERMFNLSSSREDRFIAGAGMGGYGAVKAGLLASHTFAAAASFSGELEVDHIIKRLDPKLASDIFGELDHVKGSEHDLFSAAEQLISSSKPKSKLFLWSGADDQAYSAASRFAKEYTPRGLPITLDESSYTLDSWKSRELCLESLIGQLLRPNGVSLEGGNIHGAN
jgi:putative tributyrin esterase